MRPNQALQPTNAELFLAPAAEAQSLGGENMTDTRISFGDNVRVRDTEATQAAGVAGLTGQVYGETTPSVTGVDVIGNVARDYAINVHIEDRGEALWFAPDQLEFVDHGAGTVITLKGVDKKWTRPLTSA